VDVRLRVYLTEDSSNIDYFLLDALTFKNQVVQGFWNRVAKPAIWIDSIMPSKPPFYQDQRVALDSIIKNITCP